MADEGPRPPGPRRSKHDIWASLLESIQQEQRRRPGAVRSSRIQSEANLPYERFWRHIEELASRGLITEEPLAITPTGEAFLQQYAEVRAFLARFSAADPLHPQPEPEEHVREEPAVRGAGDAESPAPAK